MTDNSALLSNIVGFCRLLRQIGLSIGPAQTVEAVRAIEAVGFARRDDVGAALASVLVKRADHRALFDEAFALFWRGNHETAPVHSDAAVEVRTPPPGTRRIAEALSQHGKSALMHAPEIGETGYAPEEFLRKKDFAQMSAEELRRAWALMRDLGIAFAPVLTRRFRFAAQGPRIDRRQSFRRSLRSGGDVIPLVRAKRRVRDPVLIVICDISGSMAAYSRILLHFIHGLASGEMRTEAFVFGTRLSNITRHIARRDVDDALARVADSVADWGGGTRIGAAIHAFNRDWSRRVLAQGAVVLLITDGLDRDAGEGLAREMDRLHRSCRRLLWLNPLLRYAQFEAKALGIRAMLPYVDEMRPVHNLDSLEGLVEALSKGRRAA